MISPAEPRLSGAELEVYRLKIISQRFLWLNHPETFFKNTIMLEIADGVTPEMRDA